MGGGEHLSPEVLNQGVERSSGRMLGEDSERSQRGELCAWVQLRLKKDFSKTGTALKPGS